MKFKQGKVFVLAFAGAVLANSSAAHAQGYPSRPITLVVPFGVGSGADLMARVLAVPMSETLGQTVVIENVPGAGGMTGVSRVASGPADGYQIAFGGVDTLAINQTLYKKPLYNAATDFAPVGLVTEQPMVLIARKDFPADDMKGQRNRNPDPRAITAVSWVGQRPRAGARGLSRQFLERAVLAQGRARTDHKEAE